MGGVLDALVGAQGRANQNAMMETEYLSSAVGNLMNGLVYRAAGKELLAQLESGKQIDSTSLLKLSQKYRLGDQGIIQLMNMMKESGAMEKALSDARTAKLTEKSDTINAENEIGLMEQTGLPRDVANKLFTPQKSGSGTETIYHDWVDGYKKKRLAEDPSLDPAMLDKEAVEAYWKAQSDKKNEDFVQKFKDNGIDVDKLIDNAKTGKIDTSQLMANRQWPVRDVVRSGILEEFPNFNFSMERANWNYRTGAANLRAAALAKAAKPRVEDLKKKANELNNIVGLPFLDKPFNAIRKAFGSETIADFESLRNAVVSEVNTALTGSSVASDYRIQLELENIQSAMTPGQLTRSIDNLLSALDARSEASEAEYYPLEVIQGTLSYEDWKELEKQESKTRMYGGGPSTSPSGNDKTALYNKYGLE